MHENIEAVKKGKNENRIWKLENHLPFFKGKDLGLRKTMNIILSVIQLVLIDNNFELF